MAARTTSACGNWPWWGRLTWISVSRLRVNWKGFVLVSSRFRSTRYATSSLCQELCPERPDEGLFAPIRKTWTDRTMRPDDFLQLLLRQPFEPFRLHLS